MLNINRFKERIRNMYISTRLGFLEWNFHVEKVFLTTMKIVNMYDLEEKEKYLLASLLHDISIIKNGSYVGHSEKSSEEAWKILKESGVEEDWIEEITEAIKNHHNYEKDVNRTDTVLKTADSYVMLRDIGYTVFRFIVLTKEDIPKEEIYLRIIKKDIPEMGEYLKSSPYKSPLLGTREKDF